MRKAVIQRVAEILDHRDSSLLVVLSGYKIVAVRDIVPGEDILHEISDILTPKKRQFSQFRVYAPIMLAARMRKAGDQMPLSPTARRATETFATSAENRKFEETFYRVLSSSHDTEIHYYTTGIGDLSHIWSMATSAYALHCPMRIFLPKEAVREDIRKEAEFFHVCSFEVIE